MTFHHQIENGHCKIVCYGPLSGQGVVELKEIFEPFLRDAQLQEITLDLQDTTGIDSSGIGLLIRGYKILTEQNRKLILNNVPGKIQDALKMTGLSRFISK